MPDGNRPRLLAVAVASILVFPLLGPLAIVLLIAVPLAVMAVVTLGPGGLLYALVLGGFWLSSFYLLLGPPFLLTGIFVALAALVLGRASLPIALIAAEIAFFIFLGVLFLAPEALASFVPEHVLDAWTGTFRSPASVLMVLAAAAACWLLMRAFGRRFFRTAAGGRPGAAEPRLALGAAALVGAVCLGGLTIVSNRIPAIAWQDCEEGNYESLIRGCSIVIARGAKEPVERRISAHLRRASAYQEFGMQDLPGAIADYSAALAFDPGLAEAYAGRGLVHERLGEDAAAVADLDEAFRLDPAAFEDGGYRLFRARGLANYRLGDFDRAIADHSDEIRLTPHYADGHLNRAAAHQGKQETEKAIADFSEAIRIEPWRPAGYIGRGTLLLAGGNAEEALADFDEAIERLPDNTLTAPAYRKRGDVLEARGMLPEALAAFEKAAALDPQDADAMAGRDRVRAALPQ